MTAEGVIYLSLRQQLGELLPDRFDDVGWHCGHGFAPSSESVSNFPDGLAESVPHLHAAVQFPTGAASKRDLLRTWRFWSYDKTLVCKIVNYTQSFF